MAAASSARLKRARKAPSEPLLKEEEEPPAKRAKKEEKERQFKMDQLGLVQWPPRCGKCVDADSIETPEGDWVCENCAVSLNVYAAIDDSAPTFGELVERKQDDTSHRVLDTVIEGSLGDVARRTVDAADSAKELRLKSCLAILKGMSKDLDLQDIKPVRMRAVELLRQMVDLHVQESWQDPSWCKIIIECLLRAAGENGQSFLSSESLQTLFAHADTKDHTISFPLGKSGERGFMFKKGVQCEGKRSVKRFREMVASDCKLVPLSWTLIAKGFVPRFRLKEAKVEAGARRLIDWFGSCADNAIFNAAGTVKGASGCKADAAIRSVASSLLLFLGNSSSSSASTESNGHGIKPPVFAYFAVWLVNSSKQKPDVNVVDAAAFACVKRVFFAYATSVMPK